MPEAVQDAVASLSLARATNAAIRDEMARDPSVVCWGEDMRWDGSAWVLSPIRRRYPIRDPKQLLRNTYRVLLTRARQGMVIFVPKGDLEDQTRPPEFYDATYEFLKDCGLPELLDAASDRES